MIQSVLCAVPGRHTSHCPCIHGHVPYALAIQERQWRYAEASRQPRAVGQDIHVHARAGSEGVESDGTQTVVGTGGNGGGTGDRAGEVESKKTERQPEGMCRQEGLGWKRAERGQRDNSTNRASMPWSNFLRCCGYNPFAGVCQGGLLNPKAQFSQSSSMSPSSSSSSSQ